MHMWPLFGHTFNDKLFGMKTKFLRFFFLNVYLVSPDKNICVQNMARSFHKQGNASSGSIRERRLLFGKECPGLAH